MSLTTTDRLYTAIASTLQALRNCEAGIGHSDWIARHNATLDSYDGKMPSGAGFDSGTKLDREKSTPECLRFNTAFHHLGEDGSYHGWTEHVVSVRPSLVSGFTLAISGRDRNDIKDFIGDVFYDALRQLVTA